MGVAGLHYKLGGLVGRLAVVGLEGPHLGHDSLERGHLGRRRRVEFQAVPREL